MKREEGVRESERARAREGGRDRSTGGECRLLIQTNMFTKSTC